MLYKCVPQVSLIDAQKRSVLLGSSKWYYTEKDAERYFRSTANEHYFLVSVSQSALSPAFVFPLSSNVDFRNQRGIEYTLDIPISDITVVRQIR